MPTRPLHSATHTIVIAKRELPTRLGLHAILTGQPSLHLPPPVSTAAKLLTAVDRYHPDAVLMGTWFSGGTGTDLSRTLLSRYSNMRVLLVANTANAQLSPRHQQILPLLSDGLTNKAIGMPLNLSEKTVKNDLADLFDRLHMTRRSQVAAWFINHTVRQPPPPDRSRTRTTWTSLSPIQAQRIAP